MLKNLKLCIHIILNKSIKNFIKKIYLYVIVNQMLSKEKETYRIKQDIQAECHSWEINRNLMFSYR